jgi:transposase
VSEFPKSASILFLRPPVMKGRKISEDLCWAIVRMAPLLGVNEIEAYTSISRAQINRILGRWRKTRDVLAPKSRRRQGRKRHLTTDEVAVCYNGLSVHPQVLSNDKASQFLQGSLDKTCDQYLDELKDGLRDICGVDTSISTIWLALKRSGYTMKKVRMAFSMQG